VEFVYGLCPGEPLRRRVLDKPRSEILLSTIVELIASDSVDAVVLVNQSPSFTLIRVLATLYNALAYSRGWQLCVVTQPIVYADISAVLATPVQQIEPHYSKAPNITYAT
jgi:hypothetical protein